MSYPVYSGDMNYPVYSGKITLQNPARDVLYVCEWVYGKLIWEGHRGSWDLSKYNLQFSRGILEANSSASQRASLHAGPPLNTVCYGCKVLPCRVHSVKQL
jgi:hypothetical protein